MSDDTDSETPQSFAAAVTEVTPTSGRRGPSTQTAVSVDAALE